MICLDVRSLQPLTYYINNEPLVDSVFLANHYQINHEFIIKLIGEIDMPDQFTAMRCFAEEEKSLSYHIGQLGLERLLKYLSTEKLHS